MPKRPPRVQRQLADIPVPEDLALAGTGASDMIRAWQSELGSLWCTDAMDLLGSLADDSVDLVVTDPPYAIAKETWDDFDSLDAYLDWCDAWLAEVHRVLAPHGSAYVCGYSEILAEVKARSARRFGACRWLVWYYRNKANLSNDWGRSHESILHLRKGKRTRLNVDEVRVPYNEHTRKYPERRQAVSSHFGATMAKKGWTPHPLGAKPRDVFEIPVLCNGMAEKTAHSTQKPEELIRRFIAGTSQPGQLVVDPFVGSGTTAVVAERLHRRWIAGDRDPRYVGLARTRLAGQHTTASEA